MDESLKSIRAIHQILIIVCAAIGIFAISVEPPENIYDRAKKGIIAIQKGIENEINSPFENKIIVDNIREGNSFQMIIFNNLPKLNLDSVLIQNIFPHDNVMNKSMSKLNIKK